MIGKAKGVAGAANLEFVGAAGNLRSRLMLAAALVILAGCGSEPPPADSRSAAVSPPSGAPAASAPAAPGPAQEAAQEGTATERAEAALRANQMFAPAGDNAFELFLAAVEAAPDDVRARNAVQDLFPYAVLHVEQQLAARDRDEAARVLTLMQRAQPEAPALPRLQRGLESLEVALREAAAAAEAAALAATAAEEQQASPSTGSFATPTPVGLASATIATGPRPATPTESEPEPSSSEAPMTLASLAPPPARSAPAVPSPAAAEPARSDSPASSAREQALPRMLRQTPPRYPLAAARRKTQGVVEVSFTITEEGRVTGVEVLKSDPPGVFDRAAMDAVEDWRYEAPGRRIQATRSIKFQME